MPIQALFLMLLSLHADERDFHETPCFDFNKEKVIVPLKPANSSGTNEKGTFTEDKKITWGKVRGEVQKPIKTVLSLLLDHNTTKSPKVEEMEVKKIDSPHFFALHGVHFEINPFPLIWVKWTEQWAYALLKGTVEKPDEVLISYQKVEGTTHIAHLCGSIALTKKADSITDVYQYEEAKATSRSPEDTVNGLVGTLETLRKQ